MTYAEKLKNPLWQKKRLNIFKKAKFKCALCGDDKTELHVHHTYYDYKLQPWEYPDESLKCLCKYCHFIEEDIKNDKSIIKTYKAQKAGDDKFYIHFIVKVECEDGINVCLYAYSKDDFSIRHVLTLKENTCNNILKFLKSQ